MQNMQIYFQLQVSSFNSVNLIANYTYFMYTL